MTPIDDHTVVLNDLYAAAHERFGAGDIVSATTLFQTLVLNGPQERDYWLGWGICLRLLGEMVSAKTAFSAAISLDPTDLNCRYHLAEWAIAMGDLSTARAQIQYCLTHMSGVHTHPLQPELDKLINELSTQSSGVFA